MHRKNDRHVVWHAGHVCPEEREQLLGQQAFSTWLTGLSASGKSTLAYALERRLTDLGYLCYVLDGDNIRHGLNSNLGFTHADRTENIRRIAEVARLMNDAGLIVISAFISPYRADRDMARRIIGATRFREIHVSTPLSECERRDPKGMYGRARAGQLPEFTGISAPYEEPENPHVRIDTAGVDVAHSVNCLVSCLVNEK